MKTRNRRHIPSRFQLRLLAAGSVASLGLLLAGPGYADDSVNMVSGASPDIQSGGMMQHFGTAGDAEHQMPAWVAELGLTGQQKADIQIILGDYGPRFRDLAQIGRDTARSLLSMAPDDPEYIARTQDASALAASSAAEIVTLLSELRGMLYAVITPEQRAQLQTKLEEMQKKHKDQSDIDGS
jgi:Spy/CpxP family protein refolding chaperone